MTPRKALVPVLLGAGLAIVIGLLTGCASSFGLHSVNCSGGKCVTTNASVGANKSSPAAAPTTATPAPAVTITTTQTPAPSDTPTAQPLATESPVAVGPCSVQLTAQDVQQLATSESSRQALMDCMQIPSDQRPAMDNWLAQHALDAVNTPDGRQHWESHQLTVAYHTYG